MTEIDAAAVSAGYPTIITITDGGVNYLETPKVTISDPTGSNAVAKAGIENGVVTQIEVPNHGRNHSSATVFLDPPPSSSGCPLTLCRALNGAV